MTYTIADNHPDTGVDMIDYDENPRVCVISPARELIRAYRTETIRHGIVADTIAACIAEDVTTRDSIIRMVLKVSPFRPSFVAFMLDRCTGTDPRRASWELGENGEYRLL